MSRAYFIDVQGTLIDDRDKKPIRGAVEFINKLNRENIPYLVITNNTKKRSRDFLTFLQNLGLNIKENCYLDTFSVLKEVVQEKKISVFGDDNFKKNLEELGYQIVDKNPEAIIITLKKDYTNKDYASMIELSLTDAKLIGMHGTSIYAKEGRSYPGVGAILAMINYATKKEYQIVGKPSDNFYNKGLEMIKKIDKKIEFKDIEIISDDVIGDLVGAKKFGIKTSFVLSGKYRDRKIIEKLKESEKPNSLYRDIGELLE